MIFIAATFKQTLYKLFVSRKHKLAILGLIVIASGISITELADRKSTRLNSSHMSESRMPSSA